MSPLVSTFIVTLLSLVFIPPAPPSEWTGFAKLAFAILAIIVVWVLFVRAGMPFAL